MAAKALRGLAHLHDRHRILHRDIKPGNLFLADDDSIVKIGDFGEAMRMDGSCSADPLLSPQFWTAPETFNGYRYSVASELYSVGLTLLEMLCGPFPYDQYSREELAVRLQDNRPALKPRHLALSVHVPAALRRIVTKATHRDPAHRFDSAEHMLDSLLGARFVDWDWPSTSESGALCWHGHLGGEQLRVSTRTVRGRGWRARAERLSGSGWRRLPSVQEADGATVEVAAATVFSQIERHLLRA